MTDNTGRPGFFARIPARKPENKSCKGQASTPPRSSTREGSVWRISRSCKFLVYLGNLQPNQNSSWMLQDFTRGIFWHGSVFLHRNFFDTGSVDTEKFFVQRSEALTIRRVIRVIGGDLGWILNPFLHSSSFSSSSSSSSSPTSDVLSIDINLLYSYLFQTKYILSGCLQFPCHQCLLLRRNVIVMRQSKKNISPRGAVWGPGVCTISFDIKVQMNFTPTAADWHVLSNQSSLFWGRWCNWWWIRCSMPEGYSE